MRSAAEHSDRGLKSRILGVRSLGSSTHNLLSFFANGGFVKYFPVSLDSGGHPFKPALKVLRGPLSLSDQVQLQLDTLDSEEQEG